MAIIFNSFLKNNSLLFILPYIFAIQCMDFRLRGNDEDRHAKIEHSDPFAPHTRINIMEIERINALSNTLMDLAARTHELRGYL